METTIKINSLMGETKTFGELLNESFDTPMLATSKDNDEVSFIVLPSQANEHANTLIYIDTYNCFESCEYDSWEGELFSIKEILGLKLEITA